MKASDANVFAIHQSRSFYASSLGAVVMIGLPSDLDNPVFRAKLRTHASYVGCDGFPDVHSVDALEEGQYDLFRLDPLGRADCFSALTLKTATLDQLDPSSPQGQVSFPSGHRLPIVDLIADLVAMLPDLELWSDYGEGGVLRNLRVPPPVYAKAFSKHGRAPFLSECSHDEGTILPSRPLSSSRSKNVRNQLGSDTSERPRLNSFAAGMVMGTIAFLIVSLFGWPTNGTSFGWFAVICLLSLGCLIHALGHLLGFNDGKL